MSDIGNQIERGSEGPEWMERASHSSLRVRIRQQEEIIDTLVQRLAAAEAAMENARDVARLIFEKATFIGTAKEHNRFPGWQKIAEMYTWLAQQEDDTAAKGGRDE